MADMNRVMESHLIGALEKMEEKLDDEITALERMDEDDMEAIRERRLQELKKKAEMKKEWMAKGHGTYRDVADQKDFFNQVKASKRVVVHFYRPTTWRCDIVDKHLSALARSHLETKFLKVNAEKSPFLVERLGIYMLPTIVLIKDGKTDHSIIGFDEFGGGDDFSTEVVERCLVQYELLHEA